jgi:hypothetical protein
MNEKLQSIENRRIEIEKAHKKNILIGVLTLIPAIGLVALGATSNLTVLVEHLQKHLSLEKLLNVNLFMLFWQRNLKMLFMILNHQFQFQELTQPEP